MRRPRRSGAAPRHPRPPSTAGPSGSRGGRAVTARHWGPPRSSRLVTSAARPGPPAQPGAAPGYGCRRPAPAAECSTRSGPVRPLRHASSAGASSGPSRCRAITPAQAVRGRRPISSASRASVAFVHRNGHQQDLRSPGGRVRYPGPGPAAGPRRRRRSAPPRPAAPGSPARRGRRPGQAGIAVDRSSVASSSPANSPTTVTCTSSAQVEVASSTAIAASTARDRSGGPTRSRTPRCSRSTRK